MGKLEDSHKKSVLEIEIDIFYQRYEEALNKVNILLSKGDNIRNIDLLMMKADICYRDEKMFECEEIFLSILQLKPPSSKTIGIYLRLGYTYLNRKSWEDAKRIFEKACEQKYNCSLAWQGLGVACLNLGHYPEAE
jgi:tetratricopeptide (TPR) repeat protein